MHAQQKLSLTLTFAAALAFAGCGSKDEPTKGGTDAPSADHKPPHGGEVLELGAEEGHLEVMHDHVGGNITVWVFGSDFTKPLSVGRPTVMVQTKAGPAEVTLAPVDAQADGTAHQWKAQSDNLKVNPWDGRISLKIGGKPFQSPLEGAEHKPH